MCVYAQEALQEGALVTPTKSSSKDDIKVNVIVDKDEFLKAVAAQGAQHRTFDWNDNILQVMSLNTTQSGILFSSMHGDGSGVYLEQLVWTLEEC